MSSRAITGIAPWQPLPVPRQRAQSDAGHEQPRHLDALSDEALIEAVRTLPSDAAAPYSNVLYARYYSKVAQWCLQVCQDREEAADLAQEVFLRVHTRLHSFRGRSRFSTWLYTITRRTAINHGIARSRRTRGQIPERHCPEPVDHSPSVEQHIDRQCVSARLHALMHDCLDSIEANVFYMHFVEQQTLPEITRRLQLSNKSGAKAYIVSAKRKLARRLSPRARRELLDT